MGTSIPVLLVTANVGSIFENPSVMLQVWTDEFLSTISKLSPKFIALHCQEVGGKNYENSMKHVEHFVNLLMSSNELRPYDKVRVYLDEDYSSAEHFTALGNFYFIHESIENVQIWNFKEATFLPCVGKETHSGNIEAVETKEKSKFPQNFFPECKWSRKGFLRTRWSIEGSVFDLINIHLFHDASNFVAMEAYPSVYCANRRRALEHTLQRFHNDEYDNVPYILFGDFNFRTDTDGVIKKLTEGLTTVRIQNNKNNEFSKLQYRNEDQDAVLTVGKKEFNHADHQGVFSQQPDDWLKPYDKEVDAFKETLLEFPITFAPSYPFEEAMSKASSYMQTRCPAWCDRVLLSHTAKKLIDETDHIEYDLMGQNTCMGDHKPVYLRTSILTNSGIITCCHHNEYCLPMNCPCCSQFANVTINVIDMSDYLKHSTSDITINPNLLREPVTRDMLQHDPYTPESAESHSPNQEKVDVALSDLRRTSVSPMLLKKRLETFLKENSKPSMAITRSVSQHVNVAELPTIAADEDAIRPRAMSELQTSTVVSRLHDDDDRQPCESMHDENQRWFPYSEVDPLKVPKILEQIDDGARNAKATRRKSLDDCDDHVESSKTSCNCRCWCSIL